MCFDFHYTFCLKMCYSTNESDTKKMCIDLHVRYPSFDLLVRYSSVRLQVRYPSVGLHIRYSSVGLHVRHPSVVIYSFLGNSPASEI